MGGLACTKPDVANNYSKYDLSLAKTTARVSDRALRALPTSDVCLVRRPLLMFFSKTAVSVPSGQVYSS